MIFKARGGLLALLFMSCVALQAAAPKTQSARKESIPAKVPAPEVAAVPVIPAVVQLRIPSRRGDILSADGKLLAGGDGWTKTVTSSEI